MEARFSDLKAISTLEKVAIYDIAFNHYGNRMAVCSSDQLVAVWNKVNDWKEWEKIGQWKAHKNPALKINWVHPEFGQALATCSNDRSVAVWEEIMDDGFKTGKNWVRKASFMESTTFITDLKFAPKTVGLLLAVCSSDGFIRIYKAHDVLDLSRWSLLQEVSYRNRVKCISWNPNGTSDNYSFKYFRINSINESDELNKNNGSMYSLYPKIVDELNSYIVLSQDAMLAVGLDDENNRIEDKIKILLYVSRLKRWNKTEFALKAQGQYLSAMTDSIRDLSFAARLGRTYDLLAVAVKDIKIYALYQLFNQSHSSFNFQFGLMYSLPCYNSPVQRINWNPVGNILISSGDDGYVRLWKQYQVVNEIKEENTSRQKNTFHMRHPQYCWKPVRIVKVSDLYL